MSASNLKLLILQLTFSLSWNAKTCSMTDKQFAKAIGRRNFHGLRGGGQEGQVSQGKKQVHEDVFSPYEISALRSLAADRRFNETDPKDPPWSYPEAPAQNADIEFADGVETAVSNGAEVNSTDPNYCDWTAMHYANGNSEVVERLTDFGANTSPVDENGWTPLHYVSNSLCNASHTELKHSLFLLIDQRLHSRDTQTHVLLSLNAVPMPGLKTITIRFREYVQVDERGLRLL
eukprot:755656-Hanusia_phi.AAC.9